MNEVCFQVFLLCLGLHCVRRFCLFQVFQGFQACLRVFVIVIWLHVFWRVFVVEALG